MSLTKRILVIEDEPSLRKALNDKLIREGFTTYQATDGKEGLEMALREHPDLVLLDIIMPVMDGMTMLSELRKDSWGGHVPVIILTNLLDADKVSASLSQNVYDYLVKTDWSLEDVVKKIRARLNG